MRFSKMPARRGMDPLKAGRIEVFLGFFNAGRGPGFFSGGMMRQREQVFVGASVLVAVVLLLVGVLRIFLRLVSWRGRHE